MGGLLDQGQVALGDDPGESGVVDVRVDGLVRDVGPQ
jgi:hypothetical protein